jgi:hypothetical protein
MPLPKERTLTLAPEELRRRQFAALTGWTIASARVQPLVLASAQGREPINLPGGRLAKVRYAPIAIKFRSAAK